MRILNLQEANLIQGGSTVKDTLVDTVTDCQAIQGLVVGAISGLAQGFQTDSDLYFYGIGGGAIGFVIGLAMDVFDNKFTYTTTCKE